MKKVLLLTFFTIYLANTIFAQEAQPLQPPDTAFSTCSPVVRDSAVTPAKKINSVYDIYWVTNCVKSGWKPDDTLMVGAALEPCDTAHPFIMPVQGKLWRGCSHYHAGWDIGSDLGTPVKAGLGGKVRFADYCSGYGKLVVVRDYSGMEIYYAHLSKIKVATGQFVEPGDTIGLVGATGHARGYHLHMEFRVCDKSLDIAGYYRQNDTIINLYKIKEDLEKKGQPQSAEYYTIVRGDNLSHIAYQYDTTVASLCSLNQIGKNSILHIGQKIKIR